VISESMCRRQCTTEADCPRGTKCAPKGGTRVCTSDH
jgi:hypothetical protein